MGKSGKQKKGNTFRFQTFTERITNINIDVIHQIRHHDDDVEETQTYFGQALQKQSELNCTDHFMNFKKEIIHNVKTFTQLVYNEAKIVETLKKHLVVPNSLALPAILDLVVQLARDLQKDFYCHFEDFFHILVQILNTYSQEVEVLEAAFTCLSYLFKFLWRYLLRDIEDVYSLFSSLLSKQYKEYIHSFAAESFAFLMRKNKDPSSLFDFMLSRLKDEPDKSIGVGRLLFEMMKGTKQLFHSCTSKVFPILLEKLGPKDNQSVNVLPWEQVEVVVTSTVKSMANHSNSEHMKMIWDMLLESTSAVYKRYINVNKKTEKLMISSTLDRLLRILNALVTYRHGKIISNPDSIAKVLIEILGGSSLGDDTGLTLLEVSGSLIITSHGKILVENTSKLLQLVYKTTYPAKTIFQFTKRLFDLALFEKDILPSLLRLCDKCMKHGGDKDDTLLLLTELVLNKSPLLHDGREIEDLETYLLDFGCCSTEDNVPQYISSNIDKTLLTDDSHCLAKVWSSVICLPHIRPLNKKDVVIKSLSSLVQHILDMNLSSNSSLTDSFYAICCQCIVSMVMLLDDQEIFKHVPLGLIVKALSSGKNNVHVLRMADVYFTHAVNQNYQEVLNVEQLLKIFPILEENLSSPLHLVRLLTLRILSSFERPLPQTSTSMEVDIEDVFTVCLNAEMIEADVQGYRDRQRYLQKLEYNAVQNIIPVGPFHLVPLRYLMGSLLINFKLLWEPTRTLIVSHANGMERNVFWDIYTSHLQTAADNVENHASMTRESSGLSMESDESLVVEFVKNVNELNDDSSTSPDYSNFRIQLWKAMHEFPEKCSTKSRVLAPLLFKFLKNEYYVTDLNAAPSQNVCRSKRNEVAMETDDVIVKESTVNDDNDDDDDTSDDSDDENDEPITMRTRNQSRLHELEERGKSDQSSNNKRKKTKSKLDREEPDRNVKRIRTRSMGEEHDTDKDRSPKKMRTRSSKEVNDDSDDANDEDDDDDNTLDDDSKIQNKGKKRLDSEKMDVDRDNGVNISDQPLDGKIDKAGNKKDSVTAVKKRTKDATATLTVKLELFAKFKDPLTMYMEPQLRQLYFDLLIHKNTVIQKTAFQCIMTYKYSYLIPYRENFNRLLDDKTFKDEIVVFSIDHENGTIDKGHRDYVMPVLMRILYGKMNVKTGKGTTGKQYSNFRQSIVFRFLNGCQTDELKIFVDLVFQPFKQLITGNPLTLVKNIIENTDLTNVLPVKKMQGTLNSVDLIFKKLAHRLDTFLPDIIQIVFGLGALCSVLLDNREKLLPYVINPLKKIRQNVLLRVIQVLETYDEYSWKPMELEAMFEALVWAQLDKLPDEGLYHPTPLLKFFSSCAKNPRYHMLLCKYHNDNVELSPLPHIFKLLLRPGVSTKVTKCIVEMIYNLLEERDEDVKYVEVTNTLTLKSMENIKDTDVGTRLLLPHIPDILVYIQTFVTKLNVQWNKHNMRELEILSRISSFVEDENMSSTLVKLLLPFLNPKLSKPLKVEEDILRSIINLLKQISDRSCFFESISKLFACLTQRTSRVLLAEAFMIVCEEDEVLIPLASIVHQLNSWDQTRMDEPNYMLRLEGYRSATTLLRDMVTIDTRICLTLTYNCCFFIRTVEDMSIRDSSSLCLITMVNQFGAVSFDTQAYNTVILSALFPEVKTGLRSKKQTVFHEFITILSNLVNIFSNQSEFSYLKPLQDKDLDADFFENIKHIQVYKRSRALRRLIKYLMSATVSIATLNNIFLPMVSSFLVDESYKKHTAVLDAAVECIGTICRRLSWKSYLSQLKYYLSLLPKKVERQKLLVRVVVSILDNFHFDLSNSTLNVKKTPVPKVEREIDEADGTETDKILEEEKKVVGNDDDDDNNAVDVDGDDDDVEAPEINEQDDSETLVISKAKEVCIEAVATKIHSVILKDVIHHLHKILVQKALTDQEHKTNKSKFVDDESILRVPIALAMVKLLQNLPKGALERYLPGILLKVCNFLRSRAIEIRSTSRDTLIKIQNTLGPRFFPFILSELKGTLRRGYQRHVLCYTVYQLLKNMEEVVKPGDIDVCLTMLQQVLHDEIFGEVSDEKDVDGIKSKVFEARSSKSYDSYEFIAKYISPESLVKLLQPINAVLDSTHSHKSSRKVEEVLKRVTNGLMVNSNMNIETLLVFVHSLTFQTLPMLAETESKVTKVTQVERPGQKPASCLLIPQAAPRGGLKPKPNKKTNKHIIVEFGLQLLGICLKKQKISSTNSTHIEMLDPLVPMLADCLYSKYLIVNANSLRVLCTVLKYPLPSINDHVQKISDGMFILLRNYARAGAAKGDNLELVNMLFKAVTVLVRDVKMYKLTDSDVQVLLTFCEEDIHDYTRQSSAFTLLKAILSRKVDKPEIRDLMLKVQEMSISAESPYVQRECRQALMQYLLDYRLGKRIVKHMKFFIGQLTYKLESGRESALEMMASFFTTFPQELITKHAGLFFVPLAASLANDDSAKCRKLIALALKTLLGNLDHNARTGLFAIALKWFVDEKIKLRSLAAQLCGIFVEVECTKFESRLSDILPLIEQQLEPGKYTHVDTEKGEHAHDLLIYNVMNTLLKIIKECSTAITSKTWQSEMTVIWEHVETYLNYAHNWVQLASCQLFGLLFSAYQPEQLVSMDTVQTGYFSSDTVAKLSRLSIEFLTQLQSELLNEELAGQVVKNMLFITKCARYITDDTSSSKIEVDDDDDDDDDEDITDGKKQERLTVLWLVRKMVREAHHEAIFNNKSVLKRMNVFKWLAAVSLDLGESMETKVLSAMLPPLQRELNDQSMYQDENLRTLAQEVVELLKKTVGVEKFTKVYSGTQKIRAERRDERKKQRAIQAVANPELAAKRKVRKNLGKIEAKKRKVEQHNVISKKAKKKRFEEFTVE
ncbi:hypothetical protein ACF0H5_008423 [Mactra antiquata]